MIGQRSYQVGGLPSLNVNGRLNTVWSLNFKLESRQLFRSSASDGADRTAYKYILTDFSLLAARRAGLDGRVAGGYLLRWEADGLSHRFIQQYTLVQRLRRFRLAHRMSGDQTFSEREAPEYRIRYRITAELPLYGSNVDPGEPYLKIAHEQLGSRQSGESGWEARWLPLLGFAGNENFNLETGLDYRVSPLVGPDKRSRYWMVLNLFLSVGGKRGKTAG